MKIYVVGSSKNHFLPLNNIRQKFLIDQPHLGDNIDRLNPWYCELTGLYYMWKNETDEIIGLEHYRRYFGNGRTLFSKEQIDYFLQSNDIITIDSPYSKTYPIKSWLIKHGKFDETMKFVLFLKYYLSDSVYQKCINFLNGDYHCLGNMFISKKSIINNYCSLIFDVLDKYMEVENLNNRTPPFRSFGYHTEFLFGAWIEMNGLRNCKLAQRDGLVYIR